MHHEPEKLAQMENSALKIVYIFKIVCRVFKFVDKDSDRAASIFPINVKKRSEWMILKCYVREKRES